MQKQNQTKLFAFKLAEKEVAQEAKPAQPWTARDGVAVAGCTYYGDPEDYNLRDSTKLKPNDTGIYC